jgi:tetratricopeptide (TPR) repeat protein
MAKAINFMLKAVLQKIVVYFLLLLFPTTINAQISIDSLEKKANEFYNVKSDPDSALKYYLRVRSLDKKRNEMVILDQIAFCYLSIYDTVNAIKYYKMIFDVPEPFFPPPYRKHLTCRRLTSIFIAKKNFKEAIKYIDLTKVKHTGRTTRKHTILDKYTEAFCHTQLKQYEEACQTLFYFVLKKDSWFLENEKTLLDSCSQLFVNALLAKYGVNKSKKMLLDMFYNLKINKVESVNKEFNAIKLIRIEYITYFLGKRIHAYCLGEMHYVSYLFRYDAMIKESIVWHIFRNPVCRMILAAKE